MDDVLLQTKLIPPLLRSERVHRAPLLSRLNQELWQEQGFQRKLTLVSASAGYGKTTLVGDWLRGLEWHAAWLSLDVNDNDLLRFTGYLVAAIQQAQPGFGVELLPLLRSPQPVPATVIQSALVHALSRIEQPLMLVLDDYHLIHTPAIHQQLAFLLDHQPPLLHLVILTREDPLLPVARLRARNQVLELRQADLRFDTLEVGEFLSRVMSLALSSHQILALEEYTEGWIAGLQLAALSLRGVADRGAFIREFTGSSRFILDYLIEEVFDRQPPELQNFLLVTSILERLCGGVCDALTGRSGSQAVLEHLEQSNLFVVALDHSRGWFRYHHLFADLLRHRLHTKGMDENTLHRSASRWFQAEGHMSEAIVHALAARDWVLAASQIDLVAEKMLKGGEFVTLTRWMAQLPREMICENPGLCLTNIWALLLSGDYTQAEALFAHIEPIAQHSLPLMGQVAVAQAYMARMRGDDQRIIEKSNLALRHLPLDDQVNRSNLLMNLGLAYWHIGKLNVASTTLQEALEIARRCENHYAQLTSEIFLVRTLIVRGSLRQGGVLFEQMLQRGLHVPVLSIAYYDLGTLAYEWNQLDQALQHLNRGLAISQASGNADFEVTGHILLAQLHQARGSQADARAAEEQACAIVKDLSPAVKARCAACRIQIALAQGELDRAAALEAQLEVDMSSHPFYRFLGLTRTQLWLAQGKRSAASNRLREIHQQAECEGAGYAVLAARIQQALAAPNFSEALIFLAEAMHAGQAEGYVRSFVDAGAGLIPLLQEAARRGIAPGYAHQLLEAFQVKSRRPTPVGLPEPLSERELEVLRLAAAGHSNRRIAAELVISLGTVKTHIHHICEKLDAPSRGEAAARARTLNLL